MTLNKKNWWEYVYGGEKLKEYCDVTTLHGFKYLGESGRSLSERVFWIVALVFVHVCVVLSIYDQVTIYINTPVLMSMDTSSTPAWNIPFPAITICSENQISPSALNIKEILSKDNLSEQERNAMDYFSIICPTTLYNSESDLLLMDYANNFLNNSFSTCNTTIPFLKWLDTTLEQPCQYMQPAIMNHGACYTFNSLPPEHLFRPSPYKRAGFKNVLMDPPSKEEGIVWTPENGFKGSELYKNMPWRTSGPSFGHEILIVLNLNIDDFDETCSLGGRGFMIYVHNPAEIPSFSDSNIYAKVDKFTIIQVIPQLQTTQKELKDWNPEDRGCFFEWERPLQFFQFYTEKNCDIECEANLSIRMCGCAKINMPRLEKTPVCGPKKIDCVEKSFVDFMETHHDFYSTCNCLPSCSEMTYQTSVTEINKNYTLFPVKNLNVSKSKSSTIDIKDNSIALVSVKFQARNIIPIKRVATIGLSDFTANIGGLMSLFLGFSTLSIFEIIYFLTLRFRKRQPH